MFTLKLLLFALSSSFLEANLDLEENPTEDSIKFFEDDQFSVQSTTTESTTIEAYKLTVSITDNNVSREFKPSIHLGEIKESRISPFNNLHHIRFDNEVDPTSYHQVNSLGVVYQPEYPTQVHQVSLQGSSEASDEDRRQVHVKFQDYPANVPKVYYGDLVQNQGYQLPGNVGYDLVDQQVFQNVEKPDQNSNYKPSKQEFQGFSNDPLRMQYGYQDQAYEGLNAIRKPFDGAVYVQEASFVRTKKFPYPFLHPPVGYQEVEQHSSYPVRER
nr:PREDICTED: uncharacterized protein LOC100879214 [Megachile rotundata]